MPPPTKSSHLTNKPRLKPPATLSKGAAAVFVQTVAAVDPDHFSAVDLPLLEQYAAAADLACQAQTNLDLHGAVIDGKASAWLAVLEKASRSCVALAARLRVCPQSRFDRLTAGANSRPQPQRLSDPLLAGYEED
jgi:phage terminase small subunit